LINGTILTSKGPLGAEPASQLPTRLDVLEGGSASGHLIRGAVGDFPAGSKVQEPLYPRNAYLVHVNEVPQALQPFEIIGGVVALTIASGRLDQALTLIEPQGLIGNP